MDISWVLPNAIFERIDATYYRPKYVNIEKTKDSLQSRGILSRQVKTFSSIEYGYMPTEDYWRNDEGHPFIRTTNFGSSLSIMPIDLKYVNPNAARINENVVNEGDVLVIQCGNYTGRTVYIGSRFSGWVFPSFSLRLRIKDKLDGGYLAALLSSSFGRTQLERSISVTSVRPNTTKPGVGAIWVPFPSPKIQQAIGDKIRKAERLREMAARAMVTAWDLFKRYAPHGFTHLWDEDKSAVDFERDNYHSTIVSPSELTNRLTPQSYRPSLLISHSELNTYSNSCPLHKTARQPIRQGSVPKYGDSGIPCLNIKHLDGAFVRSQSYDSLDTNFAASGRATFVDSGTVLVSRKGAGTVGRAAIYLGEKPIAISDSLFKISTKSTCDPAYLALYLNSWHGKRELERGVQGSTGQLTLGQAALWDVMVLRLNNDQESEIGNQVRDSYKADLCAKQLIENAIGNVESIIDGTLDEDTLLAETEVMER
jgi:hypothetical protein